jgi:hypothetical protein
MHPEMIVTKERIIKYYGDGLAVKGGGLLSPFKVE